MNAPIVSIAEPAGAEALRACLDEQRRAFLAGPPRPYEARIADLKALGRWIEY